MAKGGYRPNSGRPTLLNEQIRVHVLEKAWDMIRDYLQDDKEPLKERIKVAEHLAGKSVPQNINLGGQSDNPVDTILTVRWGTPCQKPS